jgi:hypothetical protein
MEKELKDIITAKVSNLVKNTTNNERIIVKDYNDIIHKNVGNFFVFYHPCYKNVNI